MHSHVPDDWDTPVNLLATNEMPTQADVFAAMIFLSAEQIHAQRLVISGSWTVKGMRPLQVWGIPTGEADEPTHQVCCPICQLPVDDVQCTIAANQAFI